jgi:aminoglycoside phosphotransferase family enzyme
MRQSTYRRFDRDTEAKLAYLAQPAAYSDRPRSVERIETHMAWVFLTDRHAFKLKKPVRYEFLDFSTIEARRLDCEREIELNRRLAADVYLGLVPLSVDAAGAMELGGAGEIIDWLVKMRRLPRERMLDWQLEHASPAADELRPAALLLAEFYRDAEPLEVAPQAYLQQLENAVRENMQALSLPTYGLPADMIGQTTDRQLQFLDRHAELVRERARNRHIVEGHGDLRPEHICLVDPPVVIDCLEFKREFRVVDPVDEFAFLTLECQVLGQTWVGELFLRTYSELADDHPATRLFEFYKSQRALLRAKLAAWHLRDSEGGDAGKWLPRARQYLALASDYASRALEN